MINKVVFILSDSDDLHQTHRVQEFIEHGFEVDVYAFNRKDVPSKNMSYDFAIHLIGEFYNSDSYKKRTPIIYKGLKYVADKYKKVKDIVFFYQGLSIALSATLIIKHPYIYEECDVLQTSINNTLLRNLLDMVDKRIIRKSIKTIFTSGGFLDYYSYCKAPANVCIVNNRLQHSIIDLPYSPKKEINMANLQFAFVGSMRYDSIYNFIKVFLEKFPNHDFHLFGGMSDMKFKEFEKYSNFHNHGVFKNPYDLPKIYSQIDILLCTYDNRDANVLYAEPNKLYEAIYFQKPIIVSCNTYLEKRVKSLGIGYSVNPFDNDEIISLLSSLTEAHLLKIANNAGMIERQKCINNNEEFFHKLQHALNKF